jgi:hypothetical protein
MNLLKQQRLWVLVLGWETPLPLWSGLFFQLACLLNIKLAYQKNKKIKKINHAK